MTYVPLAHLRCVPHGALNCELCKGFQAGGVTPYGPGNPPPESEPTIHSQEEFLTALDILLDHSLHADECYIDDAQTECVCVIGKVRAALPPCGATYRPKHPQRGDRIATCLRSAHPASPDRHVF